MVKRPTFEDFEKEAMKDPEFKAEYEALCPEFEAIARSIRAGIKRNRTLEETLQQVQGERG
jgi:hypothetical protein